MCGRYYRRSDKQHIADAFKLGKLPDDFVLPGWDYNVAPQTMQPIILAPKDWDRWLSRDGDRPPVDLLRPFPAEEMKAHEAHKDVGNVRNNHPELLNSA